MGLTSASLFSEQLLTCHRNPTLSYTQRLEERIKELEDQLAAIKSPPSVAASNHSSPGVWNGHDLNRHPDEHAMTRSFMGLKIDDKGGITYHGPTSLFNLPSDPHKHKPDSISSIDSDAHRRERLVNNAWHQRAMENLSDIPVGFRVICSLMSLNLHHKGTVSIPSERALVLDSASFQLYLQACIHSYASP